MSEPFEITGGVATNGRQVVQLLDEGGRLFRRRAVKRVSGEAQQIEWCVVELDGVRVYVDDANVIVTKQDLYP